MEFNHICQVEIRVKDLIPNAEYYANTFSWKINVVSEDYATVDTGTAPIGGLLQVPADGQIPIGVSPYVLVDDCKAVFEKALTLGAQRCLPPIELAGSGVYATLYDPGGTEISLWQGYQPMGDQFQGSGQNPFFWLEKPAADLAGTVGFYANLFQWNFAVAPGVDDFAFCDSADRAVGIGLVSGERGELLRGNTVYVRVEDCVETCKRAEAAGGFVHVDPQPSHSGMFAVIVDPSGNPLAISQPA